MFRFADVALSLSGMTRIAGRRLAGGINLSNVRRGVAQAASVDYWMGQPYAGQGLMTDALRASLPFVFDDSPSSADATSSRRAWAPLRRTPAVAPRRPAAFQCSCPCP
jgi:hypothetical protein